MSADISTNIIMVLITFVSNLVVARKPYLTQTLRLMLKPLRQVPAYFYPSVIFVANYILIYNQIYDIYACGIPKLT